MELKQTVADLIHEELGDCVEEIEFTGPYEGEDLNVVVSLRHEPDDFDERDKRLRRRVWKLGYDVGIFVDYPEEVVRV